eukprot:CAMPEP_0178912968 /NCGR_PEP_ID=MMETSP0786-20121207/10573_1 /TAXON_ID=186022 /ORGANISM="Thalassionema frauenfeldii, Strain CCMP 1798" /LENGTH=793 /DNA_ID=CAMNT_0020585641 /DNA_START=205 /DNA_END=2589 /DNA_ORIENTATION=+
MPPITAYVQMFIMSPSNSKKNQSSLSSSSSSLLHKFTYPQIQSCNDIPNRLPVFHRPEQDKWYGSNVQNQWTKGFVTNQSLLLEYAQTTSPVMADPFLPWIHDFFPRDDGTHVDFIAHNRRRCNTGPSFLEELHHLEPQLALFQPLSVTRINNTNTDSINKEEDEPQYRLANSSWMDDDDDDDDDDATVKETRFRCQFYRFDESSSSSSSVAKKKRKKKVILGDTFSVYPYNYELANARKPGSKPMLTTPSSNNDSHGAHNEQIWNSVLHFSCPIPSLLQKDVALGNTVLVQEEDEEGNVIIIPTVFLELVPIRTTTAVRRTDDNYVPPPPQHHHHHHHHQSSSHSQQHVLLPTIQESGRWSQLPICLPPQLDASRRRRKQQQQQSNNDHNHMVAAAYEKKPLPPEPSKSSSSSTSNKNNNTYYNQKQQHFLVGCTWASASFTTRNNAFLDTSTSDRLLEWLTYHLELAGLDHIYVYDNSSSDGGNQKTLENITSLFPNDKVTHIPWSHRVCNNNAPSNANAGERSSQYAAETSCRVRFGPSTKWMIFFDSDEYLIPQGRWNSIRHWLQESDQIREDNYILSFYQSRAKPRIDFMMSNDDDDDKMNSRFLVKQSNVTYLQAYDCESDPLPKDGATKWRAMKQIYQPSYVLNHFVHYSTVTQRLLTHPKEPSPAFIQRRPYERRVNELEEAFMLHTKTTGPSQTRGWQSLCVVVVVVAEDDDDNAKKKNKKKKQRRSCPIGIPFPLDHDTINNNNNNNTATQDGLKYNCYQHKRVQDLVPKLTEAIQRVLARAK